VGNALPWDAIDPEPEGGWLVQISTRPPPSLQWPGTPSPTSLPAVVSQPSWWADSTPARVHALCLRKGPGSKLPPSTSIVCTKHQNVRTSWLQGSFREVQHCPLEEHLKRICQNPARWGIRGSGEHWISFELPTSGVKSKM